MNEKVQDFLGNSALLIGNKAERPGKHLQLTSAFSMGTPIPHCAHAPGNDLPLRAKKQNLREKPFNSHRLYGRWKRNQGVLVP